ncbi:YegP family protein [Arthrobacter oryzae]|uniref:YegP family protein n=1 Tax=Arthrobacter oryzae TaxID=409290 RepID=UPI00273C05E0|nr:YegP family protein [Arthrobacter oryzae]WLQ05828.1 YegP family protein [Arthrobacter oryzae]
MEQFTWQDRSRPQQKDEQMAGKFELYKDKAGAFRFRLKAGNGEVIATGEACKTKAAALKGIESVKNSASGATTVDLTVAWPRLGGHAGPN